MDAGGFSCFDHVTTWEIKGVGGRRRVTAGGSKTQEPNQVANTQMADEKTL